MMCFFYSMICDCAPHHIVVCSRCCCRHQCIPRSVVAVVLAPSCIDAPSDNDDNDGDTAGQVSSLLVAAAAIADESPGSPPCRAVVPTCLRRLRLCCHPPPKTPLPKLAERDLQEIASKLSRFRVSIVVVFRRDAVAIVALPILPPNETRQH